MRVDVKKYCLLGLQSGKSAFFKRAQELGIFEFIQASKAKTFEQSRAVHDIMAAIKILRSLSPCPQKEASDYPFAEVLAQDILKAQEEKERLQESIRLLQAECARIEPFGAFDKQLLFSIEQEASCHVQFYHGKNTRLDGALDQKAVPHGFILIARDNGLDYYVGIHKEKVCFDGFVEMQIPQPLQEVQKQLREEMQALQDVEKQLRHWKGWDNFLHASLLIYLDVHHLQEAQSFCFSSLDDKVFTVEAWVPENQVHLLQQIALEQSLVCQESLLDDNDRVPTYLQNSGYGRMGQDLIAIYDTPSTSDRDPSLWVLWSFALFFAIIIDDAGYGLLFLASALFAQAKYRPKKASMKRALKLGVVVFASCFVWGACIGSFFGIPLNPDSPLKRYTPLNWVVEKQAQYHIEQKDEYWQEKAKEYPELSSVLDAQTFLYSAKSMRQGKLEYTVYDEISDKTLFEFALFLGCLHIILSLLRYLNRNWAGLGWVVFIIGGYLYFPFMLQTVSFANSLFGVPLALAGEVGEILIYGGIGAAVILACLQHRLQGALEVMTVIQIFGDILSYLRLYALGLAGSIVAKTFNEMAVMSGIFFGFFILIAGHSINIVLGLMSGVIHGLRLNFLEWYHYSFEGGGKQFQPLKLLHKEN